MTLYLLDELAIDDRSISGLRTTCQFSTKVFYPDTKQPFLWASDALSHWGFDDKKYSFHADNCSVTLSDDGTSYTIKSSVSKKAIINLTFQRAAPGIQAGKDGTTNFGTDPKEPWGTMRHAFWPRCRVSGSILTQQGELDMKGLGMFIHGLQGMRPNLAGKYPIVTTPKIKLTHICSCDLEFRQLSITHLLDGHHGVHDTTIIRLNEGSRGLHRCR